MSDNYDDLLGGRVTPSASFNGKAPGISWDGVVEDVTRNPAYDYDPSKPNNRGAQKFWPDGNPVMNVWVTLVTDVRDPSIPGDTGRRVLVLDSKNKLEAVQQAVRDSGASFSKGGRLYIEWYGNDDANAKNPQNPPKLYRARYSGPTFDSALASPAAPPTPAASAPQANWGGQAQPASPAPATGGWGSPAPASPAVGQGGWGSPTPAPAPQAGSWGAPAPVAPQIDPGLVAALQARGVDPAQLVSQEQAEGIAAAMGLTRG